jgi:bacillithiol biosynthesis cysteine-adding enzyme BshC
METHCSYIPYGDTGYFSKLIIDYLHSAPQLQPFYNLPPTLQSLEQAINQRKNFEHRQVLVEQLQKQYQGLNILEKVSGNIQALSSENTFTITTAHQPNIFTGPLYVVYKIFHTIKLAEELKLKLPQYNFVPVYFMGSEDADIDELNNITINQRKYVWETKQTGAVGRMQVDKKLVQLMNEIEGQLSVLPFGKDVMQSFRNAYKEKSTIQQSSLELLNDFFGSYGLIVLIADKPGLKKLFQPVIEKELKEQFSYKAVSETTKKLEAHYKVQASGREINLFYLIGDKRERIEVEDFKFKVEGLKLEWTQEEILKELSEYPEHFSPNVILRGAYQETILPNIAFIGGGGELAYWLELKEVFKEANVPYPVLVLRNSFLLVDEKQYQVINKLGLKEADIFKDAHSLMKLIVDMNTNSKYALNGELKSFEDLYIILENRSAEIDVTLSHHTEALKTKAIKKLAELEKKLLRAEKRRFGEQQVQIQKIKSILFPGNSLQERVENISGLYALHGRNIFNAVYQHSKGLQQQFAIVNLISPKK